MLCLLERLLAFPDLKSEIANHYPKASLGNCAPGRTLSKTPAARVNVI
jgi:hypothetical protein